MEEQRLVLRASQHPNAVIARLGFDLRHPYLEQCWTPVIGPASVMLLRRLPDVWRQAEPADITLRDLGRHVGLDIPATAHTLRRLERFGFTHHDDDGIDVYLTTGPVPTGALHRLPPASRAEHHRLVADQFAAALDEPTSPAITRRFDHLQNQQPPHLTIVR